MVSSILSATKYALALAAIGFASHTAVAPNRASAAPSHSTFAAQFPGRVLAAHNAARAQAGLGALAWDPALGNTAAAYAQQMAFTGRFEHSNRKARKGVGENLWMGTRNAFSVETMVGGWASERRMFVPGIFPAVSRTGNFADVGHYTQMIWPTTQRVGCAVASNPRTDYLVCHYWPAGNMDGRAVGPASMLAQLGRQPSGGTLSLR